MQNPAFKPPADSPKADIANHFTHADLMKSKGYVTAQVGKWQLSGKLPTLVRDTGFDEYLMWAYDHNLPEGVKHPGKEPGGKASRFWHPSLIRNGEYLPTTPDDYGPNVFNDFVLDVARRNKTKPFFVYYTAVLTHGPHLETPNPSQPGQRWPKGFKSNLEYLDHLMGQLLDGLKAEGLDENTYVIFIGDNGTGSDGKGSLTELGARVPCIIRGPGVQRGFVSRAVADLTDIMPTLADISGAELPKHVPFDGHSLAPVLRGEKKEHRDWIYSHLDDGRILRDSRWLLEINKAGKGERFFDCGDSRDGSGYKDVTNSNDAEVIAARKHFAEFFASMPEPKPNPGTTPRASANGLDAKGDQPTGNKPSGNKNASKKNSSRFQTRDKNHDGMIDLAEFSSTATAKNKESVETRFRKMDADRDGQITLKEFEAITPRP
jgi:arylsulfatase A